MDKNVTWFFGKYSASSSFFFSTNSCEFCRLSISSSHSLLQIYTKRNGRIFIHQKHFYKRAYISLPSPHSLESSSSAGFFSWFDSGWMLNFLCLVFTSKIYAHAHKIKPQLLSFIQLTYMIQAKPPPPVGLLTYFPFPGFLQAILIKAHQKRIIIMINNNKQQLYIHNITFTRRVVCVRLWCNNSALDRELIAESTNLFFCVYTHVVRPHVA